MTFFLGCTLFCERGKDCIDTFLMRNNIALFSKTCKTTLNMPKNLFFIKNFLSGQVKELAPSDYLPKTNFFEKENFLNSLSIKKKTFRLANLRETWLPTRRDVEI